MRKTIFTALVGVLCSTGLFAQKIAVQNAYHEMNNGEYADAKKDIESAIKDEDTKSQPKTWYYRGELYLKLAAAAADTVKNKTTAKQAGLEALADLDTAQNSYVKAAVLDVKNSFDDDIKMKLNAIAYGKFQSAVQPYRDGKYELPYKLFKDASNIFSFLNKKYNLGYADTAALPNAAFAALQIERFDTAKAMYTRLINNNYKKPVVYHGLGVSSLSMKDTTAALKYIQDGRVLYPDNQSLMLDELNIYLAQNKADQVVAKLKEAIVKQPKSEELNYILATKYDVMLHDTTNAIKYYLAAIELKPDYADAYSSLGIMIFNEGVDAAHIMSKLPLSEQKKYDQLKIVSDSYFTRAQVYLEKAHQLNPKFRDTMRALKQVYTYLDQKDKAAKIDEELKAGN